VREVLLPVFGAAVVGNNGGDAATARDDNERACCSSSSVRAVRAVRADAHVHPITAAPATSACANHSAIKQRRQLQ
jgi:hypothetical protein